MRKFFGVGEDGSGAFGVAIGSLYLHKHTFALVTHYKIHFKSRILAEIIKGSFHFVENVGNQILENRTLIAVEVALKYVELCAVFKHRHK